MSILEYKEIPPEHSYPLLPGAFNSGIFFGFIINNKFDEYKAHINPQQGLVPSRYSHFTYVDEQATLNLLYGFILHPDEKYIPFVKGFSQIESTFFKYICTKKKFTTAYKKYLDDWGLECKESFGYIADGLYPIDITPTALELCSFLRDFDLNGSYSRCNDLTLLYTYPVWKLFIISNPLQELLDFE